MDENQQVDVAIDAPSEQEKTLTQSQVNEIVGREKAKAKREAELKHQQEIEALQARAVQQSQRNEEVPRDFDSNAMYQQFVERMNADMVTKQNEAEMTRVANNYMSKMDSGKDLYEDFGDVTADFDPREFPQIVYLVAGLDNAADVVYDLSKNAQKLSYIDNLAKVSPKIAQRELLKLSNSISENRKAANESQGQQAPAPLDQMTSSRISGSNGKQGIRDLRNQPWLKG